MASFPWSESCATTVSFASPTPTRQWTPAPPCPSTWRSSTAVNRKVDLLLLDNQNGAQELVVKSFYAFSSLSLPARPRRGGREYHQQPALCLLVCQLLHSRQSSAEWRLLLDAFRSRYPRRHPKAVTHHYIFLSSLKLSPSPSLAATSSWIQVNLGETRKVTGIVIQGCPQGNNWVTKFKIQHSMDGASWADYIADGVVSEQGYKV